MTDVDRDGWTTPAWVWERALMAMGRERYDLDPCSNERSTVPATHRVMLPDDGLCTRLVPGAIAWLNPPYSRGSSGAWYRWAATQARRGATVCGLVRLSIDTEAWHDYGPTLAWSPRGRVRCEPPPGATESSPRYVMVPCIWSEDAARIDAWLEAHQGGVLISRDTEWAL